MAEGEWDSGFLGKGECLGNPVECAHGRLCIANSLNGWRQESSVTQMRQLLSDCPPCLLAMDMELQIRHTLHDKCQEKAPQALRINISEALGKINLGRIGPTDLPTNL